MRLFRVLVLAALALTPLAAARGAGDTLVVGLSQFPPDMHPDFVATDAKLYLLYVGQRPVMQLGPSGGVVCRLCTEVPSLANGRAAVQTAADGHREMTTRWTLRSDLFWGDGVPVTSRDAALAFAVGRAVDPSNAIDRIDILDEHSFTVHRRETSYDFDRVVLPTSNFLLPEHVEGPLWRAAASPLDYAQHSAYNRAPGTPGLWLGPYRVTGYNPASELTAVPNPYWKGHPVAYRQLVIRLIENTPALLSNLLSGDIDVMAELGFPLTQIMALEKQHGDRFEVFWRTTGLEHLAPALDKWPLSDVRVRQAVLQGIDRAQIAAKLFEGHQAVADQLLSPRESDYDPAAKQWRYDPAVAKALLASAGFRPGADGILADQAGRRLSITMTTTAGNTQRELVETVMQSQLRALGIDLVIRNEPARTMFGETLRRRNFDGFVMYARTPFPDDVPWAFLGSGYIPSEANNWFGNNYQGYANPEMDRVLAAARQELDPGKRREDWTTIDALVSRDLPVLPLFYFAVGHVQPKTMTGLIPPPLAASGTAWIEDWGMR